MKRRKAEAIHRADTDKSDAKHVPLMLQRISACSRKLRRFKSAGLPALFLWQTIGQCAIVKLEAESGVRGSDVGLGTNGQICYIYPLGNHTNYFPGTSNRIVTYTVRFPEPGTYDLYARIRVGAGAWSDDSFLYGNGFGSKSPTNSVDWILANNLANVGFTNPADVVTGGGNAWTNVWKWVNLSERPGGITFTVENAQLTQAFQIGTREDGFAIDAFVFGTSNYVFTVADLDAGQDGTPPGAPVPGECIVHWTNVFQRIDGFGASSAWRGTWSTWQADMFFTTNTGTGYSRQGMPFSYRGIGLSLLRTRIAPGGTTVEQSIMQMAQARGAKVWSTPWTPPTAFKTTNALGLISLNGGGFNGTVSNYQAYANQLAGYVANMKKAYGVDIYALSVQNEPDYNTTEWESCVWTPTQIRDFIPYLASALAASNVGTTKIIIPESMNWKVTSLYTTALNDPSVAPLVSIIANHNYVMDNFNGDQAIPAAITNYGRALWQTEVSRSAGEEGDIADGIYWAWRVHLFLTAAQVNAWHYWWLCGYGNSSSGLCDVNDVPTKRMYTLGNFSRFVRPEYYRIGTTSSANLLTSAYKETNSGAFAIVVINTNVNTAVNCSFVLTNFDATFVTPWVTSSNLSLADQPQVQISNRTFSYVIPALSVVTFAGQAVEPNSAPTNIFLSNTAIAENLSAGTAVGLFTTSDPDPSDTFIYSLVDGPGSQDNQFFSITNNTLYTARSFDFETRNAYGIRVRSTDGSGLYIEKTFTITVIDVNESPVPAPLPDYVIGAGRTLVATNIATDPDQPPQTLLWELLSGPANATIDPTNGVFSWRPRVSQADSTNLVTIIVRDNGTPPLSATNNFTVIVEPLGQPAFASVHVSGGTVQLGVTGPLGPDYTILTSTNLDVWDELLTTNPVVMPFELVLPVSAEPARYFRIKLGP